MTTSLTGPRTQIPQGNKIPKGHALGQIQQFTPQMMEQLKYLMSVFSDEKNISSKLMGGDEETFQDIENPELRQFNEQQGALSSQFSGMGTGARRSSGFQNTSQQAASQFAQKLAMNRQNLQRQGSVDQFNMGTQLMGFRPKEKFLSERSPKSKTNWGGAIGTVGGGVIGGIYGGPGGAMAGSQIGGMAGTAVGSAFT